MKRKDVRKLNGVEIAQVNWVSPTSELIEFKDLQGNVLFQVLASDLFDADGNRFDTSTLK